VLIIDTSVLIAFLRGSDTPQTRLLKRCETNEIPYAIPLICAQEVLQGARDNSEWKMLEKYMFSQDLLIPLDPYKTHREAARIYYDCRRRGLTVRSAIDCLVAQTCLEHGGRLLHNDEDYKRIAKVRRLQFAI